MSGVIGLATGLEVAAAPLGTSGGSFVFKLDPTTGLQVRAATTFGPSFADRALTSGEGKVSVGASFLFATYDRLGDLRLDQMQLAYAKEEGPAIPSAASGNLSLALSSKTIVMSGLVGVTDNLDVGVAVPLVSVKLEGISWICIGLDRNLRQDRDCSDPANVVSSRITGTGTSFGVGDIAVIGKYRFLAFGKDLPDPGGLAAVVTMRLPTGDRENLRGLGINRTLVSLIASSGKGRFQPHANGGFEIWSRSLEVEGDGFENNRVDVRHQVQYGAGLEFEAAPKLTLLVDFLGRHTLGGGRVDFNTRTEEGLSVTYAFAPSKANRKFTLVPGLKLNLKGKLLVSLNALVTVADKGLYDRFTPAVGLEWNF